MEVVTYFDFTDTMIAALLTFLLTAALYPVIVRLGSWLNDTNTMIREGTRRGREERQRQQRLPQGNA